MLLDCKQSVGADASVIRAMVSFKLLELAANRPKVRE
jgi:hypothetical protein